MNDLHQTPSPFHALSMQLKEAISAVPFELQSTLDLIQTWGEACRTENLMVNRQFIKPEERSSMRFLWPQYVAFILIQRQAQCADALECSKPLEEPTSSVASSLSHAPSSSLPRSPLISRALGLTEEEDAIRLIKAFWSAGFDVNHVLNDAFPDSLLSFSARHGLLGLTRFCTQHGGDVHYVGKDQMTIFNSALFGRHLDLAEHLLQQGADINASSHIRITALHRACGQNNIQEVQWLLSHGADPDSQDRQGKTALHYAIFDRRLDLVQLLVEAKANLRLEDKYRETPLQMAENRGYHEIVDYIKAAELARAEKETLNCLIRPVSPMTSCSSNPPSIDSNSISTHSHLDPHSRGATRKSL